MIALMESAGHFEQIEVLPLVKAYPNLSRRYGEVSCIAGLGLSEKHKGKWIRLYPVPFRALDESQQFRKYEPIRVNARQPREDRRPESWRVDADSIEVAGAAFGVEHGWESRRPIVEAAMGKSMCSVLEEQRSMGTSLQMFRVKEVLDLVIEKAEPDPQKGRMADAWAAQGSLLGIGELQLQREALEQVPFRFKYRYRCSAQGCPTHSQSIVDWEIAQFYRRVRDRRDWRDRIRTRWLHEMCGADKDTAFIVGNQHQHPNAFLVLGVWWPPLVRQLSLADTGDS